MKKMSEGSRVVIACALGALVGSLLSLEASARTESGMWQVFVVIIGFFVGGSVGYLAYRFDEVYAGVKQAVRDDRVFVHTWKKSVSVARGVGMKAYFLFALLCVIWAAVSLLVFYVIAALTLIISPALMLAPELITLLSVIRLAEFMIAGSLGIGLPLAALCWCICVLASFLATDFSLEESVDDTFGLLNELRPRNAFPLLWGKAVFFFLACAALLIGVGRVGVNIFKYIHSDARIICFVGATIGSIAGFVAGSVFVGCAAGAVMGYLEYQIVSVRWLKLVPSGDQ